MSRRKILSIDKFGDSLTWQRSYAFIQLNEWSRSLSAWKDEEEESAAVAAAAVSPSAGRLAGEIRRRKARGGESSAGRRLA